MNESCQCPHCKSDEHIVSWYSVLITLREWPLMLIVTGIVLIAAGYLDFKPAEAFLFVGFSLFPLMFRFLSKRSCLRCHIEFYAPEAK